MQYRHGFLLLINPFANEWPKFGSNPFTYTDFNFCKQCIVDDTNTYGEAYWHRSHQVRGVYVCHKHHIQLQQAALRRESREFITVESASKMTSWKYSVDGNNFQNYSKFADGVNWLLNNEIPFVGLENIFWRYRRLDSRIEFLNSNFNEALRSELVKFYDDEFVYHLIIDTRDVGCDWVLLTGEKRRYGFRDPIKHIALQIFLGLRVNEFWDITFEEDEPFGKGPWPCLNPLSNHFGEKVINTNRITLSSNHFIKGNFSCDCNYIYEKTKLSWNTNTESLFWRQDALTVQFGDIWRNEVITLFDKKEWTLTQIARKVSVDAITLIKLLWKSSISEDARRRLLIEEHRLHNSRKLYLRASVDKRQLPLFAYLGTEEATYKAWEWLMNYDKEWYKAQTPTAKPKDNELVKKIFGAVRNLRAFPGKALKLTPPNLSFAIGKSEPYIGIMKETNPQTARLLSLLKEIEKERERKALDAQVAVIN